MSRVGDAISVYEYRRLVRQRATALGHGGLRDSVRNELSEQYNAAGGQFKRAFVVGKATDVCERAAGVAMGRTASARNSVVMPAPLSSKNIEISSLR